MEISASKPHPSCTPLRGFNWIRGFSTKFSFLSIFGCQMGVKNRFFTEKIFFSDFGPCQRPYIRSFDFFEKFSEIMQKKMFSSDKKNFLFFIWVPKVVLKRFSTRKNFFFWRKIFFLEFQNFFRFFRKFLKNIFFA